MPSWDIVTPTLVRIDDRPNLLAILSIKSIDALLIFSIRESIILAFLVRILKVKNL